MFPHQKLDWTLSRLDQHLADHPEDTPKRAEYAWAALSRALWHDGGELWFNKALTQARRVLHDEPAHHQALIVAGAALVGLDRIEPALQYLDQASRTVPDSAELHLALGAMHEAKGERHQAVRELELACREAPDSWEVHARLGLLLRQRVDDLGNRPRVLERSQFHLVRALQLCPSPNYDHLLQYELSLSCLQNDKLAEAHKLLSRLAEQPTWQARARYHLGVVAMQMGKFKNAILYLRQHLADHGDSPHVYARMAVCYLQLDEFGHAREACHQALALQPDHREARWALGCAFLEEGRTDDGVRLFREVLRDAPEYTPAFIEIVKLRREARDSNWITEALRAEVAQYDRLPSISEDAEGRSVSPRNITRQRIKLLVDALFDVSEDPAQALLDCISLTTDEALRASLWESVLEALARANSREVAGWLDQPGRWFGSERSAQVLALAPYLPEPALSRGLHLSEEDLQRAAVDRQGPAKDVMSHRRRVDAERHQARTWQAMLLLAIATKGTETGRNLLLRWAAEADAELSLAATAGLALLGDPHAQTALGQQPLSPEASQALQAFLAAIEPSHDTHPYRPVSDDERLTCTTCGRRSVEVDHLMVRNNHALCDRCLTHIARHRRDLATDDPRLRCVMTDRTIVETRELYVYNGTPVASEVLDRSLGLLEREEVDRFLAQA